MRVGINATALLSPRTGIGQYIYNLGREFIDSESVQPRFFYAWKWDGSLRENSVTNIGNVKSKVKKYVPQAYAASRFLIQGFFSAGLSRNPIDLYHEPNYLAYGFRGPTVITVHDLSWIRHPETHPKDRLKAMNRYFPRSLEQAAAILTDCDFVKQELVDVFGVNPARVHSVLLGVSSGFRPYSSHECKEVLSEHGLEFGSYFLSVGTLEPRKNVSVIVDAFSRLPRDLQKRCPLVLVGMRGWLTSGIDNRISPYLASGLIRLLGYVPDGQMHRLYSGAAAFVFPSLYEGFGLPPLEAMACGVPVIVSNSSSLPEVVGTAGVLVNPLDVDAISAAMRRVCEDRQLSCDLAQLGIKRASGFTWRKTAEETFAVYRKVLAC